MRRMTPSSRPAFALALAGVLLLGSAVGASAGASLCPEMTGGSSCPMMAHELRAEEMGRPCHGGTAVAAVDCCSSGEAPATLETPSAPPSTLHQPLAQADAFAETLSGALPRTAALDLLRVPERPPEDGLYTLHRAFLI